MNEAEILTAFWNGMTLDEKVNMLVWLSRQGLISKAEVKEMIA